MIPDEAVEAAADIIVQGDRGACECRRSIFDKHDVSPPCSTRRQAMRTARSALEAAAPYMLAEAWGEGFGAGWNDCLLDLENGGAKTTVNPYMLNNEGKK